MALVSGKSLSISEPVGGRRPEWGIPECGWGHARLQRIYDMAFRFRHSRDGGVFTRLQACLRLESERIAWREKWKRKIDGRLYLDDLVAIVLLEEWLSHLDRQRLVEKLQKRWPEGVYERQIQPKQRRIGMVLDAWCSTAHEHVARRIRQEEPEEFDFDEALA